MLTGRWDTLLLNMGHELIWLQSDEEISETERYTV
jgi:hypothetical protein